MRSRSIGSAIEIETAGVEAASTVAAGVGLSEDPAGGAEPPPLHAVEASADRARNASKTAARVRQRFPVTTGDVPSKPR
jgi:hypothetical protein